MSNACRSPEENQSPAPDAVQWTRDPASESYVGAGIPQQGPRIPDGPRVPVEGPAGQWAPIAPPLVKASNASISVAEPVQACGDKPW
eukprot:tig00020681_g12831.t1